MRLAEILDEHWAAYVEHVGGLHRVPLEHRRAVEAVLSCRTPRMGGSAHRCTDCGKIHYAYHSCNHRACPQCGAYDQRQWASNQQVRLLPVPYYMVTPTVPEQLRWIFLVSPREAYGLLFEAASGALRDLCRNPRHLGADPGFLAFLHTWTREMLHHPHLHLIVPAVGLRPGGCSLAHPKYDNFLVPWRPLIDRIRNRFKAGLAEKDPGLYRRVDPAIWKTQWRINCRHVGRGKTALRYAAAYVCKSAFSEPRLQGYDRHEHILLRCKPSDTGIWKTVPLEPVEFIRRWLIHVLPKGFVRVRHYGWLGSAAHKTLRRVRHLLGLGAQPKAEKLLLPPLCCHHCDGRLEAMGKIPPQRGPPLHREILTAA